SPSRSSACSFRSHDRKAPMLLRNALLLPALAVLAPRSATAQEVFAGVLAHDVHLPVDLSGQEGGVELELGYRTGPIVPLGFLGGPSLYVRGALAASGGTDFVSAGLSWRLGRGPVYIRPELGVAVQ